MHFAFRADRTTNMAPPTPAMVAATLVITLAGLASQISGDVPSLTTVQGWAKSIQLGLKENLLEKSIGYGVLTQSYQNYIGTTEIHVLNGSELVQDMAAQLSKMFDRKLESLKKLKAKAEESVKSYKYDPLLKMANVDYFNMKEPNTNDTVLTYNPRFRQPVSLTASGVHIPLEIYEGYPEILNGLKWSETLDEVFKNNLEENLDLSWQFFGSTVGYMRVYPASEWKEIPGIPDLYDVRRRPWYIQGSTSPKDMLIMMDVSGSVHGQTFEIMKIAVKTLLNTLEENDYVNVAWFRDEVGWVTCFTDFVQANSWNKEALFEGIDRLEVSNMASYSAALEFAFLQFRKFDEKKNKSEIFDNIGAECHKAIMFFTDGGTERPDDIIQKYNKDKDIRIFSYAVGAHAIPVHTIKSMACSNRGFFNAISTMGAVRTKIQQYPNVLMRAMALHDSRVETYSTVYTDAGGLGMVITITLPVFNRSEDSGNQSSVGVVGIDTPVEDIASVMPMEKTGPNSYAFAINQNGFVILHPKMKGQHVYLEDAPDVDFLDLEDDRQTETDDPYKLMLRNDMINEKTSSHQIRTYVNTGDQYHTTQKNLTYFFTPIINTSISLGITIPEDRKGYIKIRGGGVTEMDLNLAMEGVLLAPRNFCSGVQYQSNMTDYIEKLANETLYNLKSCNEEMVRRLIWDIERTRVAQAFWPRSINDKISKLSSVFVGTEGGVTRVYPKSEVTNFLRVSDPLKSTYFKKSLYYPTWTFMVSEEIGRNAAEPAITAVKAIISKTKKFNYNPAVFGAQIKESAIFALLEATDCENETSLICYLLDDGGYIITSNQENRFKQIGRFLGHEDPVLMHSLNNRSVYKMREEYDYHAICSRPPEIRTSAASRNQYAPSVSSLFQFCMHAIIDSLLWLLLSGWNSLAQASGELGVTIKTSNYSCTKVRSLFYFAPTYESSGPIPTEDKIICESCNRSFAAVRLVQTNLLLVVATHPDYCPDSACPEIQFQQKSDRILERNASYACERNARYRRRPKNCFANHPLEDTSECSAGFTILASPFISILALVTLIIAKW